MKKTALLTILAALMLASAALGQSSRPSDAAAVTEIDINGLKVLVKRRASAPTVAVGLFIRGGARNLADKPAGIENLMLKSAIEAGSRFPRTETRRVLARTGGSIDASSGYDFSVAAMSSTKENFDRLWDLFTNLLTEPVLAKEDVDRVREQLLTSLREIETSPDGALEKLEERVVFAGHPYSKDVGGTLQSLPAITPQMLRDHHRSVMQTSRLLLVVVGDIDAAELRVKVAASLGKLPRGDYKEAPLPALDFSRPTLDLSPRTLQTNYVKGTFAAPSLSSPDHYAMRVAVTMLNDMVNEEVRYRRQLSYAPAAEMDGNLANTANIYVTAVDANTAIKVMLDQIKALKSGAAGQEEIDGLAGQFLTTYYIKQETNAAQAADLARYELTGGGWRNSLDFLARMQAVKEEDVRNVAIKYMKNIRFSIVGNSSAIDRSAILGYGY